MGQRNKEVDNDIKKRFGHLADPHHNERITGKDYWEMMKGREMENPEANPDLVNLDETPWMNKGYRVQKKREVLLHEAILKLKLTKKARLVLDLYMDGYSQKSIVLITGMKQPNVVRQIQSIAKKLKKILEEDIKDPF